VRRDSDRTARDTPTMRFRFTVIALAAFVVARGAAAGEPFVVERTGVRIEVGGRVVAPVAVADTASELFSAGGLTIDVERNRVRARDQVTGKEKWVAALPAGSRLEVLASGPRVAYARWWRRAFLDGNDRWSADEPTQLRRLSLADGTWMTPRVLAEGDVAFVAADARGAVVISAAGADSHRVTCFEEGRDAAAWSRTFPSPMRVARFASDFKDERGDAAPADAESPPVVLIDDQVILCAGTAREIVALDRRTGETDWAVARIWEYERHDSNGEYSVLRAKGAENLAALARQSRIAAGPFVVGTAEDQRVFVAVTRVREAQTETPIEEGFTYEIRYGVPISVTRLPRPVRNEGPRVVSRGVLWSCKHGALALQQPSHQEQRGYGETGSTDRVGTLRWYREFDEAVPPAWLRTGLRHHWSAITGGASFAIGGAPFIRAIGDKVFRIPLRRFDLDSGVESSLEVVVPFGGDLPAFDRAKGERVGPDGEKQVQFWEAWGIRVVGMKADDGRLGIELSPDNGASFRVTFDVASIR
jgi:hypothetical protein